MWPYDPVYGIGGITIFRDKGCWDDNAYFPAGEAGEEIRYNTSAVEHHNFHTNVMDGVMIPFGYHATFYEKDGFRGREETLYGKEDEHGRTECQQIGMGDDMDSLIVEKQ